MRRMSLSADALTADSSRLSCIAAELAERGWAQRDGFLSASLVERLAAECRQRLASGALTPASVGRGAAKEVRENIRSDHIQWLDAGESAACDEYLALMNSLRLALNRSLFLGLEDYESHFAWYPPGAFYRRHVDRFRDDDLRVLSAVLYLNEAWLPEHGGQLRLYPPAAEQHDVQPLGGRLVLFLSAEMPHEVLPANRERLSLTGWFKRSAGRVI